MSECRFPDDVKCGKRSGHVKGCRAALCTAAEKLYRHEYRARKPDTTTPQGEPRPRTRLPIDSPELTTARARVARAFEEYDAAHGDKEWPRITPELRAAIRELARALNAHAEIKVAA